MRDDAQPPAGAISLSEYFERVDSRLFEAQRQAEMRLKAAEAVVPAQPNWFERCWDGRFDEALEAWGRRSEVRAVAKLRKEVEDARQAVHDERVGRLVSGEWSGWGRENSSAGPWRLLSADIWQHVRFRGYGLWVRGNPPIEFYNVRVAPVSGAGTAAAAPRRRNAHVDAVLKNKIETVLATAKKRWPDKRNRPAAGAMAIELVRLQKAEGYGGEAVRKILNGTYSPARRLGIGLDW